MSIYQKVNQTKMVKKLFWINFPEGCLSLTRARDFAIFLVTPIFSTRPPATLTAIIYDAITCRTIKLLSYCQWSMKRTELGRIIYLVRVVHRVAGIISVTPRQ